MAFQRQAAQTLQHLQPVQSGQHHLHHDHIREQLLGQFQQLKAVSRLSNDLHVRFVLKGFHQMTAKLLARVRDSKRLTHSIYLSPSEHPYHCADRDGVDRLGKCNIF